MPPNAGFILEIINNTRAVIFGGGVNYGTPINSVYIIDIIKNTCGELFMSII